jgi:hypothetical protein
MGITYSLVVPHQEAITGNDVGVKGCSKALVNSLGERTPHLTEVSLVHRRLIDIVGANAGCNTIS